MANSDVPYTTTQTSIPLFYICNIGKDYQPHQAHKLSTEWTKKKQEEFLDSLFRRAYVPAVILRELDFLPDKISFETPTPPIFEVLDGVQRIKTIQRFFNADMEMPKSLKSCSVFRNYGTAGWNDDLPIWSGYIFDFPPPLKYYVTHKLTINAVTITGIGDKNNKDHETTTLKILKRIHQNK
jgi:hypothetical protein